MFNNQNPYYTQQQGQQQQTGYQQQGFQQQAYPNPQMIKKCRSCAGKIFSILFQSPCWMAACTMDLLNLWTVRIFILLLPSWTRGRTVKEITVIRNWITLIMVLYSRSEAMRSNGLSFLYPIWERDAGYVLLKQKDFCQP